METCNGYCINKGRQSNFGPSETLGQKIKLSTMGPKTLFAVLITLCGTFPLNYGDCRFGIIESGVNEASRREIVNKHNQLRLDIANGRVKDQPRGVNLKRMEWDNELAEKAQDIANTCVYEHVKVNDDRWSWVGQNLYRSRSTSSRKGPNWEAGIMSWFNEHEEYRFNNRDYDHYTQVVWATTTRVGCGYAMFRTTDRLQYQKLYVCNYGPGGNIIGEYPYETGNSGCENLCSK